MGGGEVGGRPLKRKRSLNPKIKKKSNINTTRRRKMKRRRRRR